jgi:hypothetical protein
MTQRFENHINRNKTGTTGKVPSGKSPSGFGVALIVTVTVDNWEAVAPAHLNIRQFRLLVAKRRGAVQAQCSDNRQHCIGGRALLLGGLEPLQPFLPRRTTPQPE